MKIDCEQACDIRFEEFVEVYQESGLGERRPIDKPDQMHAMLRNANLLVTCRVEGELIGLARCVSDFAYVTYLADLAVKKPFQRRGLGAAMIEKVRQQAPAAKVVLLSAPGAMDYYPKIGFKTHPSPWVMEPLSP